MGNDFNESAHLNIDKKKFKANYDKIDWSGEPDEIVCDHEINIEKRCEQCEKSNAR